MEAAGMFGLHSKNICPHTSSPHFKGYRQVCRSADPLLEVTPWLKPSQQVDAVDRDGRIISK